MVLLQLQHSLLASPDASQDVVAEPVTIFIAMLQVVYLTGLKRAFGGLCTEREEKDCAASNSTHLQHDEGKGPCNATQPPTAKETKLY